MSKFRKKPVVIEAMQWLPYDSTAARDVTAWLDSHGCGWYVGEDSSYLVIPTLEGDHAATPNDWVIRGVQGEFYPCKPDIFDVTYEAADQEVGAA